MKNSWQILNEMIHSAPQFFIVAPLFIIFLVLMVVRNKRQAALLKCIAEALHAEVSGWFIRKINGEYKGLEFLIECIPSRKHAPSSLEISIFKDSLFKLQIQKETILRRIGKKINLLHEVEIHNELFDKEFYISSSSPEQAVNYLNKSFITTAIKELFDRGFCSLAIGGGQVFLKKMPLRIEQDLDLQNITMVLDYLTAIACEL